MDNGLPSILWDIPVKLLKLARVIRNFMFYQLNIGDLTISVWMLLGGVGLVALILYSIIKS